MRAYLDVSEGLRCLIWGKPDYIDQNRVELYKSYTVTRKKSDTDTQSQKSQKSAETKESNNTETFF